MALINCPECNKEISDSARKCPHCGYPLADEVETVTVKTKGFLATARMIISIVSFVIAAFIMYQSRMVLVLEALSGESAVNGTLGFTTSLLIAIAAIVGICTRNRRGVGPFFAALFYFFGFLVGFVADTEVYADLPMWALISLVFSVIFMICAFARGKRSAFVNKTFFLSSMVQTGGPVFLLFLAIVLSSIIGFIVKIFS